MHSTHLIKRPLLRVWLMMVIIAFGGAFMRMPVAQATNQASPFAPLNCPPGETEELIEPTLLTLSPSNPLPGETVQVTGYGGYIQCSGGLYNESARSFDLTLDGAVVAQLGCYANRCQTTFVVPTTINPGNYQVSTVGGSQLRIDVQAERPTFLPTVFNGLATSAAFMPPVGGLSGCPANETATLIPPSLASLNPSSVAPGGSVEVVGNGGYIHCSGGLYNESARSFDLMLDGAVVAQLGCYANRCQTTFVVPTTINAGIYQVSTVGGSELTLVVE
ncbi:hypothetical protein [Herpetosiphon geysericola]|uniref:IPT/TIG domain-containing protein n=1 Tax=Herpetosiphon geysericola TaxID=70996 RepID=A0A0P6YI59_9CHLR|nr:hypothetical protein [Herpetosiphon geysericola]KPL90195.1 hypothetical protein SE18_08300 [Herpetosiphon geysericola]